MSRSRGAELAATEVTYSILKVYTASLEICRQEFATADPFLLNSPVLTFFLVFTSVGSALHKWDSITCKWVVLVWPWASSTTVHPAVRRHLRQSRDYFGKGQNSERRGMVFTFYMLALDMAGEYVLPPWPLGSKEH